MSRMSRNRIVAILALAAAAPAFGQAGRAFTYQGQLKNAGQPVTGTHDIQVSLYASASGGTPIGTLCKDNVAVTEGVFTIELDFGPSAFDGSDRYLELAVRADSTPGNCGGPGFTVLTGRQRVSPTPYAVRTLVNPSGLDAPDGSPANAVSVNNAGYVGVNTATPSADVPLAIRGAFIGGNTISLLSFRNDNDNERWRVTLRDNNLIFNNLSVDRVTIGQSASSALVVNGATRTSVLEITGGSDIAEPFNVAPHVDIKPGMVVSIDPERVGELRLSAGAYDTTVAGIVSGANGVNTGLTLTQKDSVADGKHPVALTGRVWCWCDASTGAIKPGDLLTTSATPGHAMKASDPSRTNGAVIGKAMSTLETGTGLVLVLVNLQ